MKDPEKVSADLKLLSKKYRTKYFYFLNSSINPTKVYVNNLLKSFTNNNVSVLFTDCASFRNMDEKLLEKLKANGATRLIYGLETASPRLLKYINKSLDIAHAERMLKKSFELGIISEIELIPGLPYERDEDIKKTVRFVEKNKKYIQHANIFKFWLDGWFLKAPDRFGLRLLSTKEEKLYIPGNKRVFEEISGLNYRQKIEQTEKSYRVLRKHSILYHINDVPGITIDEYLFIMNITHIMYRQSGILKKRFQKYNQIAE